MSSKNRRLRAGSIGSASAWLPSRRSTGTHRGAAVRRRVGHSGRVTGTSTREWTSEYRWDGIRECRCRFHAGAWPGTGPSGVVMRGNDAVMSSGSFTSRVG